MAGVLAGCQVILDLSTSVGFKKKQEVRSTITQNGGVISYIVTRKSTHVVLNDAEKADVSYKCKMAAKFRIPVVSLDFIYDSVSQGKLLDTDSYLLVGKTKAQEFSSGKISAGKSELKPKEKKRRTVSFFNPKSVKAWKEGDKNMPSFSGESEVAKFAMFQKYVKKSQSTQFAVLEIHAFTKVTALDNKDPQPRFCVCSHTGNVEDLQDTANSGSKEFRFVQTSEEALGVFSFLYKQMKDPPNSMNVCRKPPCQYIGTKQCQKLMLEYGMEETELSAPVAELMQHIWREAGAEIEGVLSNPLPSIKLDQVEKATAILSQMKESQSDNSKLQALFEEFYKALPHCPQHRTTSFSMSWLARKLDLCQLIKDMVSVNEATNWSTRGNAEAQYKALRCQISHVSGGLPRPIQDILNLKQGEEMRIQNVYAIQRPSESEKFRSDLKTQPLFHASNVENFVGILSRGLLMPKVVVDDYGGKRTDPGMLGHGIYFASSASTSIKYSKPSKTRNTRMMLVSQVALGTTLDVYKYQRDLTAPPHGYHSVHGVAKGEGVESDFQDDEFVVYNTDQQMLSYLIEFMVDNEIPVEISVEKEALEREETLAETTIDISDVHDVTDPLSKVKVGLVSNDDTPVALQEAHIRAKLIDLAGEVVVLQEYHNNSEQALEAKYVFPLDDMAAVCGFEAFINGKHIVGEVKEKETAHREYKRAIQEGHGAYLMDQDEETPEVFTVSVGNLPPGAVVVIKITYVTELQVDGDLINFRLPGSVAPWKQKYVDTPEFKDKDWDTVQVGDTYCSVQVYVDMPFDIRSLECPTHKVLSKRTATKAVVQMKGDQTLEDGFQLLIGLAEIHVPRMWVESDEGESQACMLTFYPEFEADEESEVEVILMIDSSNSMKDSSLRDAKKAALLLLHVMDPTWRFNVVSFGTAFTEYFPSSQPANKFNIQTAKQHIQRLQANQGNTELCRPLNSYYLLKPESSTRNIFLFSDGYINNDEETLAKISQNSQHTRIFTMGVSSVANGHLLKAIARVGAGSYEFYDSKFKSKWEDKVKSQLQKAAQPVLTSVSVDWRHDDQHPAPIQAPQQITALFSGSRQVVYGFVDNCYMATLRAKIGGQEISTVVSTSDLSVTKGKMLHRLTAKGVIRDWEDGVLSPDRTSHEVRKMNLKQYVIELSKRYSIVTSLTSFVAIEKREKDEILLDSAPNIKDLLDENDVDLLNYLSWNNKDESVPNIAPDVEDLLEKEDLYIPNYALADNEEMEELKSAIYEEEFSREEEEQKQEQEEILEKTILEEKGKKRKTRKRLSSQACIIPSIVTMMSTVQASIDKMLDGFICSDEDESYDFYDEFYEESREYVDEMDDDSKKQDEVYDDSKEHDEVYDDSKQHDEVYDDSKHDEVYNDSKEQDEVYYDSKQHDEVYDDSKHDEVYNDSKEQDEVYDDSKQHDEVYDDSKHDEVYNDSKEQDEVYDDLDELDEDIYEDFYPIYQAKCATRVGDLKLKRSDFFAPQKFKKSDPQSKEKASLKICGKESDSLLWTGPHSREAPCPRMRVLPIPNSTMSLGALIQKGYEKASLPTLDPTPRPPVPPCIPIPSPPPEPLRYLAPPQPPECQREPKFYDSLFRSLPVSNRRRRQSQSPESDVQSTEDSKSPDEPQAHMKSTQPVSWRWLISAPLHGSVPRVREKRVSSPPSDPFVSIYDESEPLLGDEETPLNIDFPSLRKWHPSEEGKGSKGLRCRAGPMLHDVGELKTALNLQSQPPQEQPIPPPQAPQGQPPVQSIQKPLIPLPTQGPEGPPPAPIQSIQKPPLPPPTRGPERPPPPPIQSIQKPPIAPPTRGPQGPPPPIQSIQKPPISPPSRGPQGPPPPIQSIQKPPIPPPTRGPEGPPPIQSIQKPPIPPPTQGPPPPSPFVARGLNQLKFSMKSGPPPPPIQSRQGPPPPPIRSTQEPPPPPIRSRQGLPPPPPPILSRQGLPPPPPPIRSTRGPPPPPIRSRQGLPPPPPIRSTRGPPPPPIRSRQGLPPPPKQSTRGPPPPPIRSTRGPPPPSPRGQGPHIKNSDSKGDKDERRESSALARRRRRNERRSTGIVSYDNKDEEEEKDKEEEPADDKVHNFFPFCGGYRTGKRATSNTVFQRVSDEKVLSTEEKEAFTMCLIDATPLALGVEDATGNFIVIIPQNTYIPCRKKQVFTCYDADQTMAEIRVYEGCYKEAKRNSFLGNLQIENLGTTSPGKSWVTVTMEIDENNITTVAVKDNQSATELISVTVDKEERDFSKEQIEIMIENADMEDYKSQMIISGIRSRLPTLPSGLTGKALDDINSYGIGTSVSNIRKTAPNLSLSSLRSVFSIQQSSSWKLDESFEEMFGIDRKKCIDVLQRAGLSSLGKQVASEVFDMLSSALALLLIYKMIVPELFPVDFSNPNTMDTVYRMVKEKLEGMNNENTLLVEPLRRSVEAYTTKRKKYDWVCSMLELGHSWEEVAGKMLGYISL